MDAAIIGLVGVVVGGVLTASVNSLLEWRRRPREAWGAELLFVSALTHAPDRLDTTIGAAKAGDVVTTFDEGARTPTWSWPVHRDVRCQGDGDEWRLFTEDAEGNLPKMELTHEHAAAVEPLVEDGNAELGGLWAAWMRRAAAVHKVSAMGGSPLVPYQHRTLLSMEPRSPSRCSGSCSPTSPAPAGRSWAGCGCGRCGASGSSPLAANERKASPSSSTAAVNGL